MAGPVFFHELRLDGRHLRSRVMRWCYAGWLLMQLTVLLLVLAEMLAHTRPPGGVVTDACDRYFAILVYQQFILLVLIVPALLAGAVADEKTSGTLQYLLTTDLSVGEILLGKLAARASLLATLCLLPLPLLCLAAPFAGLDLLGILTLAVCTAVLILALGSAGLLASVWSVQTRNAVVSLYCCLALAYAALRLLSGRWAWFEQYLHFLDPMYPVDLGVPADDLRERGGRLLAWIVPWLVFGLTCFGLAVTRMLPAYLRQLERSGKKKRRHWWTARRPRVWPNPVLWKERHVEGLAPLPFLRALPAWLAVLGVIGLTVLTYGSMLFYHLNLDTLFGFEPELGQEQFDTLLERVWRLQIPPEEYVWRSVVVLLIASLVVAVRCSGAITSERERQTWEALLLSPMETRQIILGKFWGILGGTLPYLIAYAVPALAFSLLGGWTAVVLTSLFLGVTCLGMAYAGAAGIWCSAHAKSSWRSLLTTLMWTYVGGMVLYCIASPFIAILALVVMFFLSYVDQVLGGPGMNPSNPSAFMHSFTIAAGICLAGGFLLAAWRFLADAEHRISRKERIKHWTRRAEEEFRRSEYRRRRRPRYLDEY
jgi:ABC-type transport system involved in multi-copper enzyme maturation permease subunit